MPETAKIIPFPQATQRRILSSSEIATLARAYLDTDASERSDTFADRYLCEPDVLLSVLSQVRSALDRSPKPALGEAVGIYSWLLERDSLGFFDERDYFLGEAALVAGGACRLLGKREEAEIWLDRAESAFRHIVNPAPALANVAYIRLSLHYDSGRYDRTLESLPSLSQSFAKLKMERESLKCRFLEAMCLKNSSRTDRALAKLLELADDTSTVKDDGIQGLVLLNLGDLRTQSGAPEEALVLYQRALALLQKADQPAAVAHLKGLVAETLRAQGQLSAAVESFRAAIADYATLGMATWVAYLRVVLSETLIAASRSREAEWEIMAALPTIEEQRMVPEGFAAVALLRESVARRKADPIALRELREYMRASN